MSYVVIAYPEISKIDFELIQEIREKYDLRQFNVVKPHVTFVFPTAKLDEPALINHVKQSFEVTKAFSVVFSSLKVVEDHSKSYFHIFLVPSVGSKQIVQLHDALYSGDLESELRHDIPFIPHLGIANDTDRKVMDRLVDKLSDELPNIHGQINKLILAKYDGNIVTDIMDFPLSV